jgi:hypothetical protein
MALASPAPCDASAIAAVLIVSLLAKQSKPRARVIHPALVIREPHHYWYLFARNRISHHSVTNVPTRNLRIGPIPHKTALCGGD